MHAPVAVSNVHIYKKKMYNTLVLLIETSQYCNARLTGVTSTILAHMDKMYESSVEAWRALTLVFLGVVSTLFVTPGSLDVSVPEWIRYRKFSIFPISIYHWALVVGYSPFSLCVIHKEGLCPSSGDISMLMMWTFQISCWNLPCLRSSRKWGNLESYAYLTVSTMLIEFGYFYIL
jgi:hypothetical protein